MCVEYKETMARIFIHLTSSEALLLEGLRRILCRSQFRISNAFRSTQALFKERQPDADVPDLVIIDAESEPAGDLTGETIDRLRAAIGGGKVVVISGHGNVAPEIMERVDGLILKSSSAPVVVKALELISLGERIIPPMAWGHSAGRDLMARPARSVTGEPEIETLSEREKDVFRLLAHGSPNKVIARQLGLSEATIKMHMKSILRKTGSRNRTEAALLCSALFRREVRPN